MAGIFSGYQINVPQLYADIDREKAKRMGVQLSDIFETMQINLGSLYVNDFNRFGRTYQVIVQADAPYRMQAEDIAQLKTRNAAGELVPLGSLMDVKQSYGPDRVERYNTYVAADINGGPAPGVSSGQAEAAMEKSCATPCLKASATNGRISPTSKSSPAIPRYGYSRCACCWSSWCWPRCMKAGRCRWRSSSSYR